MVEVVISTTDELTTVDEAGQSGSSGAHEVTV
jgi:hypothetical protein